MKTNTTNKRKKIRKTYGDFIAVLSEEGLTIYWKKTKTIHSKQVLGFVGTVDGKNCRHVFLHVYFWDFGFTEADLNSCGWATAIDIETREPFYPIPNYF